jgi:hypothetical protein
MGRPELPVEDKRKESIVSPTTIPFATNPKIKADIPGVAAVPDQRR